MEDVIHGVLYAWFETGTEGIVWSLYEEGREGYDGLNPLKNGDHLTVLEADGATVIWEGTIDLDLEINRRPYPMNPQFQAQAVDGFWVHGLQRDVEPETWSGWFHKRKRARLRKAPDLQKDGGAFHDPA